jgi:Tol biopolymer transport system component
MSLEPGALLNGRYRFERVLGHGGMGAVYLATDESLGIPVAVKENLNVSEDAERLFRREATLLASLRHPNLPRVTNHFVLGDEQYLVMDFVEGEDLRERLHRLGPLSEADVVKWASQICSALAYLHERTQPIIHRDIKPANIRLTESGEAMLVDFGIAKVTSDQRTQTNIVGLTPGFAPVEQYGAGGRTDGRTDEYALAATLYTLLTGETPSDSLARMLGNAPLKSLGDLRPDLSPHVAAAITRALEVKPEDRFPTVAEFKAALLGQALVHSPTVRADVARPTVKQGAAVAAAQAETLKGAALAPEAPTSKPNRALPVMALAGLGGGALVIALIAGVVFLPDLLAGARATDTPAPTIAPTSTTAPTEIAGITPPTDTPAPATSTATLEPSPTPEPSATPTPEPTFTPTIVPTQVGGGGRIAFVSNRDGQFFQIYTMNPDGSDVQPLTTDPRNKWSPDWELGRLGTLPGKLLAWNADGAQLIYTAETEPGGPVDLWVINADGTNPQNLTAPVRAGQANENDYHPAWCSDGTIAFTSIRNNSPQVFIIQSLDNREARNYSTTRANPLEYNPLFFPDCRRMLLISTQNGAGELWRVFPFNQAIAGMWATFPASGEYSYRTFLSELAQGNVILDASLSPDGTLVAYTRQSAGGAGNNIIIATVEDSQLKMVFQEVTTSRSDTQPDWSPDSRYLVFVSKRDGGKPQIFRTLVTGAEQVNLSNNSFTELSPAWQP